MPRLFGLFFVATFLCLTSAWANSTRDLAERLQTKAENGDIRAAYKLGLLWSQGEKIAPDYMMAAEWFERAARGNYTRGMLKLGDMYLEGQGVAQDFTKAIHWYEKAAQKRSKEAMTKLGAVHAAHDNFEQSVFWHRKAAVRGDVYSMRELGRMYFKGTGVRFDLRRAFVWWELAAQKGDRQAQSLQRQIIATKGQSWADDLRDKVDKRMMPVAYWNAR